MSKPRLQRTERVLETVLQDTGLPYCIERGRKHKRIILAGRQIGVFSYGMGDRSGTLGIANLVATIKREAKRIQTA